MWCITEIRPRLYADCCIHLGQHLAWMFTGPVRNAALGEPAIACWSRGKEVPSGGASICVKTCHAYCQACCIRLHAALHCQAMTQLPCSMVEQSSSWDVLTVSMHDYRAWCNPPGKRRCMKTSLSWLLLCSSRIQTPSMRGQTVGTMHGT